MTLDGTLDGDMNKECARLPCTQGLFHLRYSDTHGTCLFSPLYLQSCHIQDCLVLKAFFATLPAVYRVTDLIVTCSLVPCAKLPCPQGLFHLRYSDTHGTIYYLSVSRTVCFPQCAFSHVMYKTALSSRAFCTMCIS